MINTHSNSTSSKYILKLPYLIGTVLRVVLAEIETLAENVR